MKNSKFILLAGVVFMMFSCHEKKVFVQSYIMNYYATDRFFMVNMDYEDIIEITTNNLTDICGFESKGERKLLYDNLCTKHSDTNYNRYVYTSYGGHSLDEVLYTKYLRFDFETIDLISDKDFDEFHPAGNSLSDLLLFFSTSPMKYIKSGYSELYDWDNYSGSFSHLRFVDGVNSPVEKKLAELTSEDMAVLGISTRTFAYLKFLDLPTLSKSHKFTLTMTADDGRVFTASIDMEFE